MNKQVAIELDKFAQTLADGSLTSTEKGTPITKHFQLKRLCPQATIPPALCLRSHQER